MATIGEILADFIVNLNYDDIPAEVISKTKTTVLHNIGVGTGGLEYAGEAIRAIKANSRGITGGKSTVMLEGTKTDPMNAAFINSIIVHARGQEDVHGGSSSHLGPTVMTAVIALAESLEVTGKEFLTAMIAGYETSAAVGEGWSKKSTAKGFRATSLYGVIGAAAGAAKLLKLNKEKTISALGFAASFASGLNQTWLSGTSDWRYQTGHAARDGILAALLADEGALGAPDAFEGTYGFYACFTGERPDQSYTIDRLGKRWGILEVKLKPYPHCALNQSTVHTALRLLKEQEIATGDIESVKVSLSPYAVLYPGVDFKGPFTSKSSCGMSNRFCLSVANRNMRSSYLKDINNKDYLRLVDIASLAPDANLQNWDCQVELKTRDGQTFRAEMKDNGSLFNYTFEEDLELLREIISDLAVSEEQLEKLAHSIDNLSNGGNISMVMQNTLCV